MVATEPVRERGWCYGWLREYDDGVVAMASPTTGIPNKEFPSREEATQYLLTQGRAWVAKHGKAVKQPSKGECVYCGCATDGESTCRRCGAEDAKHYRETK